MIPKAASALLPLLWLEVCATFPAFEAPAVFAGQIEAESCITATHPKCWNPSAELKTSREYGFGLGQITKAYRADGSVRFDNFVEAKRKYRELKDWTWETRLDPRYQMRAMILMDKECFRVVPFAKDGLNRAAMMLVCYNSGLGGILQDRQLCRQEAGCDPDTWFNNIEKHSLKSRIKVQGYGKSFFDISREYPRKVLFVKAPNYGAVPWKNPKASIS